jgi:hypothetical protein
VPIVNSFNKAQLLTISTGLWEPALTPEKNSFANSNDPKAVRSQLKKLAKSRLPSRVGEKYKDIVVICFTGNFVVTNNTKEDLKLQQAFRSQVVNVLKATAENA